MLQQLLANGLQQKREQANLARDLTSQNHVEIRDALFQLVGQQSRYKRLDSMGMEMSKQISNVQDRLRSKTVQAERATLEEELSSLKKKRETHKLQSSCERMCSDLRTLLNLGASISPLRIEKDTARFSGGKTVCIAIDSCLFFTTYVSMGI